MSQFIQEAKRRSVIRVAGLYLTAVWLLLQIADTVLPMLDAPDWVARTLLIVLVIGFVPVLVVAWVFEWTPGGLVRDGAAKFDLEASVRAGKRLDRWIMLLLALALSYFAVDKFLLSPQRQQAQLQVARKEGRTEAIVGAYGEKSIAVLPFRDMSQKQDQQYLSDGLAEQVLQLLSEIRNLRVISRSSAFAFRDQDVSISTIGKKLDVGYVLEGSVRQAGDRIRITVRLVEAHSDTDLWSDTYDRPMGDIFAIQDEIAAGVVEQLKVKLFDAMPKVRKTDPRAFQLYLQAHAMPLQDAASYEQHIDLLEQALAIDPGYVGALNALSIAYGMQASFGLVPSVEGYKRSREVALKALSIDRENSQALTQLADIALRHEGNLSLAAQYMQRALGTGAQDLNNFNMAEDIAKSLGRMDDAVALNEYIIARDPLQAIAYSQAGIAYQQAGMLDKSLSANRTALELEPGQPVTHFTSGVSLLLQGRAQLALAEMKLESFEPFRLFGLALAHHSLGEKAQSDAALAETVAKYSKDAAYNIAYIHAWRGETDQAFQWLDKAIEYKDSGLPMVAIEPLFSSLKDDPRWLPFLRKQGKSPEQLAAIRFALPVALDKPGESPAAVRTDTVLPAVPASR